MRKTRDRKPSTIDAEHLRMLHEEAIDQLELMRTALEAAEQATGTTRDNLEELVLNHWNVYLDVLHMIWLQFRKIACIHGVIFFYRQLQARCRRHLGYEYGIFFRRLDFLGIYL